MTPNCKLLVGFAAAFAAVTCISPEDTTARSASSPVAPLEAAAPTDDTSGPTVELPAFEVKSEKDNNFVGKSSLSSTRIAVDLSEIPQSVKVINNSFIQALG